MCYAIALYDVAHVTLLIPCVPSHGSAGSACEVFHVRRSPVLAAMRGVLRLHRTTLPPPLRVLGDDFLREEFRRHVAANATREQWREFVTEWERYTKQAWPF